jgi:hypothetical protein
MCTVRAQTCVTRQRRPVAAPRRLSRMSAEYLLCNVACCIRAAARHGSNDDALPFEVTTGRTYPCMSISCGCVESDGDGRGHIDVILDRILVVLAATRRLFIAAHRQSYLSPPFGSSSKPSSNHLHRGFLTHYQTLPRRCRSVHCDIRHPGFYPTRRACTIHSTIRQTLVTTTSPLHTTV